MTIPELRSRRLSEEISIIKLAAKAGLHRCRISAIENGHAQPNENELGELKAALEQLIEAKAAIRRAAIAAGWPTTAVSL
jgi:transcriptional regulator with XRE-family HTH domain